MKKQTLTPPETCPRVRHSNYFRTASAAAWGPRDIPDFEFIFVVRGQFLYKYAGGTLTIPSGWVICIPPKEEHIFEIDPRGGVGAISCIHLEFGPGCYADGDYGLDPFPERLIDTGFDRAIHASFRECATIMTRGGRYSEELLSGRVREIWLRLSLYQNAGAPSGCSLSPRVKRMVAFLERQVYGKAGRQELAKAFRVTPEHINALFKKELGVSPTRYLNRLKALEGWRLVREEGRSVKETAELLGFHDAFYFSKVFKRVTGESPSGHR